MKVRVYALEDHDVLERFFGEQAGDYPMADFGPTHCTLIFDGSLSVVPDHGDVLVLPEAKGAFDFEYIAIHKNFFVLSNSMHLIVHKRHFEEGGLS